MSERLGLVRYVSQQIYYSLQARDAEYELVPAGLDQGVGDPRLEPAGRRPDVGQVPPRPAEAPEGARQLTDWNEPPVRDQEATYDVIEAAGRDRRGARRLGRAGRARLAARAPGRHLGGRRRPHRRAARRQPRGRRASSSPPTRSRGWTRCQPAAADLPPLAPGQDGGRPALPGRPRLAGRRTSRSDGARLPDDSGARAWSSVQTSASRLGGRAVEAAHAPAAPAQRAAGCRVSDSTVAVKRSTPAAAARRARRSTRSLADALALAVVDAPRRRCRRTRGSSWSRM